MQNQSTTVILITDERQVAVASLSLSAESSRYGDF